MSVSAISSNSLFDAASPSSIQSRAQQFQQEFQQLGKDLQSGNLSAAQADFASLQNPGPQTSSSSPSQSNNPIALEFAQLAKDLQSGNLSAAQQDFAALQQNLNTAGSQGHHHHHHVSEGSGNGNAANSVRQAFTELSQALQAGNLSNAQKAYTTLQQDFQQFAQTNPTPSQSASPSTSSAASTSVSVHA
jgi:outer membrane protein assembly factor BamD (BamD/ComL family)